MQFENNVVRRENKVFARIFVILSIVLFVLLLGIFAYRVYIINRNEVPSIKKLFNYWEEKDYNSVYDVSGNLLEKNPLQNKALTFRGFSCFFLALSQTDLTLTQNFLEECINCLRIAMRNSSKNSLSQIYYMLGKAYFHKNDFSNFHYYSDLAIKYLCKAQELGYNSSDIPEYLGLSYAELGETELSIKSFTEALLVNESDELLLAIAQQYYKFKKANTAKQYLYKINQESSNELLVLKSRILLAQIYIDENKYEDALSEFESVLSKDANSADAYYGVGVIYEKQGDMAKARAEWRKALRVQVNHPGALSKMGK